MSVLSQTAVEQFKDQGYCLRHEPLFDQDGFTRLCSIFEEHLEGRGEKRSDQLDVPHFGDPRLLEFLLDESVLDLVEDLIGPDIGLWASHFISKESAIGRATPWHSDAGYWNGRFVEFTGIVTVWLAIDRSDRRNGCMRVIPGTHKTPDGEYVRIDPSANTFDRLLPDVDESNAVYFELDPNHCSFHDSRLVHGALSNTSDRRRTGYTMRYFSQSMKLNLDHPGNKTHRMWHCRGANPHGNPVEI